ncbi:sigma-70 family RNA polymerase sigma factor [bacterium]|nr:sigma-70 family RNA polymerase sigma factor [bacterium]
MEQNLKSSSDMQGILKPLDPDIMQILVKNHKRFLSFLSDRVGGVPIAEDLLQQSFKKMVDSPPDIREESNLIRWFYRVINNTLIDYYRAQGAEKRGLTNFKNELKGNTAKEEDSHLEEEVCACFVDLLATLRPEYAHLIRQADLSGRSVSELAQELKITENNLYVKLHRARQALRMSLERACGTCATHGCFNCTCQKC